MSLPQHLQEYISACFTAIWIETHEHDDALREIAGLCRDQDWKLACWDVDRGLQIPGAEQPVDSGGNDPLAAIKSINTLAGPDSSAILVLSNFHRFMQSAEIIQALAGQITAGKQNRTFIVVLSPIVEIPTELEKQFVVLEHELPGREQLEELARIRKVLAEHLMLPSRHVVEIEATLQQIAGSGVIWRKHIDMLDHTLRETRRSRGSGKRLSRGCGAHLRMKPRPPQGIDTVEQLPLADTIVDAIIIEAMNEVQVVIAGCRIGHAPFVIEIQTLTRVVAKRAIDAIIFAARNANGARTTTTLPVGNILNATSLSMVFNTNMVIKRRLQRSEETGIQNLHDCSLF